MPDFSGLPLNWFARPAVAVAPDLVGCQLVRQELTGPPLRGLIVETEAYEPGDPACHGYRRQTARNGAMFGPPGMVYVYLIYGMYHCINVSTDGEGVASAVLIRAVDVDLDSWDQSALAGLSPRAKRQIAAGPGKLCRCFGIDRQLDGKLLGQGAGQSELWVEPRSPELTAALQQGRASLVQTTRIGLTQGVDLPWRWYLADNPAVSKR
jgi:DNA-3-methyladenine glycosylase